MDDSAQLIAGAGDPSTNGQDPSPEVAHDPETEIPPARRADEAKEDRAVALRNLGRVGGDRKPLKTDDDALGANDVRLPGAGGLDTGSATLVTFLGMRPFLKTFFWVADRVGAEDKSQRERCQEHKAAHPKTYNTCLVLDLILVSLCCLVIIAIAVGVAAKTIFG